MKILTRTQLVAKVTKLKIKMSVYRRNLILHEAQVILTYEVHTGILKKTVQPPLS
jgi:hypothetical protein